MWLNRGGKQHATVSVQQETGELPYIGTDTNTWWEVLLLSCVACLTSRQHNNNIIIIMIIIVIIIMIIVMNIFLERLYMFNCAEQGQIQKYKTHAYKTLKTARVHTVMQKHQTKQLKKQKPQLPY